MKVLCHSKALKIGCTLFEGICSGSSSATGPWKKALRLEAYAGEDFQSMHTFSDLLFERQIGERPHHGYTTPDPDVCLWLLQKWGRDDRCLLLQPQVEHKEISSRFYASSSQVTQRVHLPCTQTRAWHDTQRRCLRDFGEPLLGDEAASWHRLLGRPRLLYHGS